MLNIRTFDMRGRSLGNGSYVGSERFVIRLTQTRVTLPESLRDRPRQGFARFPGNGLGEPVGLGIFDIQAYVSFFLYHISTFFTIRTRLGEMQVVKFNGFV